MATLHSPADVIWIEHESQRLGLLPAWGGSVAAWQWQPEPEDADGEHGPLDLWRPWDGVAQAITALACYPLVPWSNRIAHGGFEHRGRFHPLAPNTADDPYPLHGDGWLQPWRLALDGPGAATMTLASDRFGGGPHTYLATQGWQLVPGGMVQTLAVRNEGAAALPFGLGLHPWFIRTPGCRLSAAVSGVWLSRPDRIPTHLSPDFPSGWNLNDGVRVNDIVIDNAFSGWHGHARMHWPQRRLRLDMQAELWTPAGRIRPDGCLLYSPAQAPVFCFEPISHPIDAPHLPGQPGWVELAPGQEMGWRVTWRFAR